MQTLIRNFLTLIVVLGLGCGLPPATAGDREGAKGSSSVQTTPGQPGPQSASDSPKDVPDIGLSPSQKQTIYQSIRNQQVKKSAEPIGFRAAVGAHVPEALEVSPLPKTIVELMPKMHDYEYAFVANEVLIIDPKLKTVVEVIRQ
jgi:hypothetical protein